MLPFQEMQEKMNSTLVKSSEWLSRAKKVCLSQQMTGPYRAPASVAFIERAQGTKIWDVDGNEYLDFTMGYGPLILGHAHPISTEAAVKAAKKGTVYAIAHPYEVEMAELLADAIPCANRVAFCNSGTEATMAAIKIARASTGKTTIATFEGCYHGVHDYALVSSVLSSGAGPVEAPEAVTDCAGVPDTVTENVVKLAYNREESLQKIRELKDELAVVIIEPVPSGFPVDMGDFLRQLREVTRECGVLLMFDEVISGFRCAYGGGQEKYDVIPDMATYGKIIGGGYPAGAVVGSDEAMKSIISTGNAMDDAKERKVFSIGTFSGNPVTMQVGAAVIKHLRDHPHIYRRLDNLATSIKEELNQFAKERDMEFELLGENSWFMPYMGDKPLETTRDIHNAQHALRNVIFSNYMRSAGIFMPDLHIVFLSTEHSDEDIRFFVDNAKRTLETMRAQHLI